MRLLIVILLLGLWQGVHAQDLKKLYKDADGFRQKYEAGYFYGNVNPRWIGDKPVFWYGVKTPEGQDFVIVDAEKKTKRRVFDRELVAKALSVELGREIEPSKMPFGEIAFEEGLKKITFTVDGFKYTYDRDKNKIVNKVKEKSKQRQEGHWGKVYQEDWEGTTRSPDRKKEAFIKEGNLFVRDLASGKVSRLSDDGAPGEYYSSSISWSPDSRKLVSCKYRPAWVRKLRMVVSSPNDQLQPKMEEIDYVKPGDALPIKKPVLFLIDEARRMEVEFPEPEKQYSVGNIQWDPQCRYFTFDYNKRGHQEYTVYKVMADALTAQVLVREKMPTFICYNALYCYNLYDRDELLWMSERDGWRHLYLYDTRNGGVKRQLTQGAWVVKRVLRVDEKKRTVYLVGCGKDAGEDPYLEKIYCLNMDTGELKCLTPENGNHKVVFSKDYAYFTDV